MFKRSSPGEIQTPTHRNMIGYITTTQSPSNIPLPISFHWDFSHAKDTFRRISEMLLFHFFFGELCKFEIA